MTLLPWFVILLLVAINALYVAAEFAVVAVQRSDIAQLARGGSARARGLLSLLEDSAQLDRYIAACQIGITLSSLVAGAYGQATIAVALVPWLERALPLERSSAENLSFSAVLLLLTGLQVVLGELVPKSLALQFPERTALATFLPTRWSVKLYRAFIVLLNGSGFLLLRPFGINPGGHQHVHSPEELEVLFAESHRRGALTPEAHGRLGRGLHLSERTVRQMMTPRHELVAIEASTSPEDLLQRILESPYSQLPVYRGSLDRIIGAIGTKAVVGHFAATGRVPPIEQLLRPIPFVPEALHAHRFVRFLQQQHSSKAIVVDEHGGVQGFISMEDVLWELFGEIGDELKQPEPGAEALADGTVRLPGSMRLDEAAPWLAVPWEGPATTVAGHVVASIGRLPTPGERLTIDGVEVVIETMSRTAVRSVIVRPRAAAEPEPGPPAREERR